MHYMLSDVAATPLVTEHKPKRHNAFSDFFAIVNAGIRTGAQDASDSCIFAKQSMARTQRVRIYLYVIDSEYHSEYHRHLILIGFSAASRTVKHYSANILIINIVFSFNNNILYSLIFRKVRIETIGNESFSDIFAIQDDPFSLCRTAVNNQCHVKIFLQR